MVNQQPTTLAPGRHIKVLVVEGGPEPDDQLGPLLESQGYEVKAVGDGPTALEYARAWSPDLLVLDVNLPGGVDGNEVCRRLRLFSDAYVIMVTARADEVDMLVGLAVGADDFMTRPFSERELLARINVLMRRPRAGFVVDDEPERQVRDHGSLSIDLDAREVTIDGVEVHLTRIEFDLLEALTRRPSVVSSRQVLLEQVWGPMWVGDDHVVDVHIANLRKKIDTGRNGSLIKTIRGVGYRMT